MWIEDSRTLLSRAACNLDVCSRSSIVYDFTPMKEVIDDLEEGRRAEEGIGNSRKARMNVSHRSSCDRRNATIYERKNPLNTL